MQTSQQVRSKLKRPKTETKLYIFIHLKARRRNLIKRSIHSAKLRSLIKRSIHGAKLRNLIKRSIHSGK